MNKKIIALFMAFTLLFPTLLFATQQVVTDPIANPLTFSTNKNETLNEALDGAVAQDKTAVYTIVSQASHGVATIADSSSPNFSYVPTADYIGSDSFTYKVGDGTKESEVATVTITVEEPSAAPVALELQLAVEKNTILNSNLSANAGQNATLTYIIVAEPTHGTLTHSDTSSASFSYSPTTDYLGTDSFTYKVNDGKKDSNVATVTLTIKEPEGPVIPFNYRDMQEHWANYSSSHLAARSFIIGEEIGGNYYFYPEREMTRSDFMLFLLAITETDEDANIEIPNITFADSSTTPKWLIESAKLAYAKGIIKGSSEGNAVYLNPYKKLTRIEAITMINNVLKPENATKNLTFLDSSDIPTWGLQSVKNLVAYEIVKGNADNTFKPFSNITRAQAAELCFKLVKQLEKDALSGGTTTDVK